VRLRCVIVAEVIVKRRLGVIQAKFYADNTTTQYIHREYVLDVNEAPRTEFFAICHTGKEDGVRMFLLSAEEIAQRFRLTPAEHSRPQMFVLPGNSVLRKR
jgi:hypothetical protein